MSRPRLTPKRIAALRYLAREPRTLHGIWDVMVAAGYKSKVPLVQMLESLGLARASHG